MKAESLPALFLERALSEKNHTAIQFKKNGVYQDLSWNHFVLSVYRLTLALRLEGLSQGKKAAILSENRPEWNIVDLAILSCGAASVPIYPTSSAKEIEYILDHSDSCMLFLSTKEQYEKIKETVCQKSNLKKVVMFDSEPKINGITEINFEGLLQKFDQKSFNQAEYEVMIKKIMPDDLATIIYTSGTTGPPKGVMLSHKNFLVNCYNCKEILPISSTDVSLSFLPLSHVFERMGGYYLCILCAGRTAYAENMNTVSENLLEIKPTISRAVPRFFEKIHANIQNQAAQGSPIKRKIFNWAMEVGKASVPYRIKKQNMPFALNLQHKIAYKLVFSKIYQKLGGRLRFFVSGGAPLSKDLAEFFYAFGILILEGYGLTETSPVMTVNRFEQFKFGSVGLPLKDVQICIGSDDEILVKGPSVMKGYYKNESATKEAIVDGWFHTGDLGRIDQDGFLFITGRKKDIIVNSGGKKISPQNIENLLLANCAINQIVLIGDQRKYITALIVPNFDALKRVLPNCVSLCPEEIVKLLEVHNFIRKQMDTFMIDYAPYEQIRYFTLLAKEFSHDQDEVTITLKLKRKIISEHFQNVINRMYDESQVDETGRDRIFYLV